jgi:hypothetical protein
MRCRLCSQSAGWFRRRCRPCSALWKIYEEHSGAPLHDLLRCFAASGAAEEQIRAFLAGDPDGGGSIQDRIAAEMTNQLFGAFGGTQGRQNAEDVRRLRARGAWKGYGERPPE